MYFMPELRYGMLGTVELIACVCHLRREAPTERQLDCTDQTKLVTARPVHCTLYTCVCVYVEFKEQLYFTPVICADFMYQLLEKAKINISTSNRSREEKLMGGR